MKTPGLFAALVAAKVAAVPPHDLFANIWTPFAFLWQDAAVVAIFACLEAAFSRNRHIISVLYALVAGYVAVTVPVLRVLATPLTWTMWQAAGGALADSMLYYATPANMTSMAMTGVAAAIAPRACRRVCPTYVAASLAAIVVVGFGAARRVDTRGLDRNAITALVVGPWPNAAAAISSATLDWRAPLHDRAAATDLTQFRGAAKGRHVVMISLESTAAQYLGLYGAAPDVMPNLSVLAESAIVFDNAYAVYPESIKGLFATICSEYPAFDRRADIYAEVPCRSVASELASRDYRTALLHSGRFQYLGMNAVIRNRGFGLLADAGDIGGNHESSFGVEEAATVAHVLEYIDRVPHGNGFFVTYLPIAGHHPYATAEPGPFRDDTELGRYQNALHEGDRAIGSLVRGIRDRGLERHTIWVIFGDHGEAFGQHPGNFGHTFQLYEENVHVPFLIAAPGLIPRQTRSRQVVSLLDVAPSLLDFLGIDPPSSYDGVSVFGLEPKAALFFADYSLGLVGLRDGPMKFIHELESGRSRLFDLETDPKESVNLAERRADSTRTYADRLKRWVVVQQRAVERAANASKASPGSVR